jgi:hypothetical protein
MVAAQRFSFKYDPFPYYPRSEVLFDWVLHRTWYDCVLIGRSFAYVRR